MIFGGRTFQKSSGLDEIMRVGSLLGEEDREFPLSTSTHKERPCKDTERRQQSTNFKEGPHQESSLYLDLGLPSLQNCEHKVSVEEITSWQYFI